MPHPCTRALQFLFSAHGASGYALLKGAPTLICRYHSLYSTPVGGVEASDEPDPAQRRGVAGLEVREGG